MNASKKLLSCMIALAAIIVCFFVLPTEAQAASESDLIFGLFSNGESYYISECKTSASGDLVIPAIYEGKPVTCIQSGAFENCIGLTRVTIPDSVTEIRENAFRGCTGLTSVNISNNIISIENAVFKGCNSLTTITLPDSVGIIGERAFEGCHALTSINIPNKVRDIGKGAFSGCRSMTSITIPDKVTRLKEAVFVGCESLTNIIMPNVTDIGPSAFANCTGLTNLTIPGKVSYIGTSAFRYCDNLKTVTIGNNVSTIGEYAFEYCPNLTSVIMGKNVKIIKKDAFASCKNLEKILLPKTIDTINERAFWQCPALKQVYYAGSQADWDYILIYNNNDSLKNAELILNYNGSNFPPCEHVWNSGVITQKATCKSEGNKTFTCTLCNNTKTEAIPKLTTHTPGAEATETAPQTCTICGYIIKPAITHNHNFMSSWTADEQSHWHTCPGCEEKDSYADHTWENGLCTVCGASDSNATQPAETPTESSDPTDTPTVPSETPTEGQEPSTTPTEPAGANQKDGGINIVLIIILSVVLAGGGAAAATVLIMKKKHYEGDKIMALIKCPECKKKISDQCGNCPHCGYPIQGKTQQQIVTTNPDEASQPESPSKKPFYKKPWVWIVVGIALAVIIVGVIFLLTHNTKPKLDKDGNPVFVELTTEVYTNAKEYKGYHVNIKGQVFQVMSDDGNTKGIQIWLDPETCEQNMMIYYSADVDVKQGDYIVCTGYIDSVSKYKNAYGATLYAPLVISTDLKQATYIEVMAPTTETITPENLTYKKYGYSITIDKVEFSEKETRVYATVANNGGALMYIGEAVIVQNGKQFRSTSNYEANYDELPYEIVKGATSSGIIVFPAMPAKDFELTFNMHSDNFDEEFDEFAFVIGQATSDVLDFGYKTAVQTMIDFYNDQLNDVGKVLPQTLWESISKECNMTIAEVQETIEECYTEVYDLSVQSFTITHEERLSKTTLQDYLAGINNRYGCMNGFELDSQSISDGYQLNVETTKPNGDKVTEIPVMIKIDDNWYWIEIIESQPPFFATGPFTPAA